MFTNKHEYKKTKEETINKMSKSRAKEEIEIKR